MQTYKTWARVNAKDFPEACHWSDLSGAHLVVGTSKLWNEPAISYLVNSTRQLLLVQRLSETGSTLIESNCKDKFVLSCNFFRFVCSIWWCVRDKGLGGAHTHTGSNDEMVKFWFRELNNFGVCQLLIYQGERRVQCRERRLD